MKITRYDPEIKAAIIEAAKQARAADKPWTEALDAAKAVGYTGTTDGLGQMLRLAGGKKPKQAKAAKQSRKPAKTGKKSAKAPKRYDPDTKAAIVQAARDARDEGKTWAEAFEAAKAAGYRGTLPSIVNMMMRVEKMAAKAKRKLARLSKSPTPAKRGPGRPPKAKQVETGGLSGVEGMIERIVNERVKAALDQAIAALQQAKGE